MENLVRWKSLYRVVQLTSWLISDTHTCSRTHTHTHAHGQAESYNNSLQFKLITWCTWGYDLAFSIAIKPTTGRRAKTRAILAYWWLRARRANLIISGAARKAALSRVCQAIMDKGDNQKREENKCLRIEQEPMPVDKSPRTAGWGKNKSYI